jgi:hypothetical protein
MNLSKGRDGKIMNAYAILESDLKKIIALAEEDRVDYNEGYSMALSNTIERLKVLQGECKRLKIPESKSE